MRIGTDGSFELTYCTNIHPGNGLQEVLANLRNYAPALRERLAPDKPFGVGLRLSGRESSELLQDDRLQRFKDLLDEHGLYVFTLNGFPHGPFHRQAVKADVHAPDWRSEERVEYTVRLAEILAYLLPEGSDGGISTSPLSYKPWVGHGDVTVWKRVTHQVVRVVEALVRLRDSGGKLVHLDIEPEPDGLLENSVEVVRFYEEWLLTAGAQQLAGSTGVSVEEARALLLDHVRVCLDTCHMSLAYEDPGPVLDRFEEAGIRVGKVQISSALKAILPAGTAWRETLERSLLPFAESTYLHQIVQRNRDGTLKRYHDLAGNISRVHDADAEQWRIHFHVPIFVKRYGEFYSTQDDIRRVFDLLRRRAFCRHLEIETYTWEVLPPDLKLDLLESIHREYTWVRDAFA
ncbi:MAG: metabolite traffic protein EboE [Rubrobacter sp.]